MAKVQILQTNFSAGEVDPKLIARKDVGAYGNGALSLQNVALLATGGGTRRYGTWRRQNLGAASRLIGFDYDIDNRYIFALQDTQVKIYSYPTGTLLQTLTGAPWALSQLFDITFTQLGSTMVLCHQAWPSVIIKRTSSTTFTLSTFSFETSIDGNKVSQPYASYEDSTVTLTPSGNTGSINITASTGIWTTSHVGARIRIYGTEILLTSRTSSTVMVGTVKGTLEGKLIVNPFRVKVANTTAMEVTHIAHGMQTGSSITFSGANAISTTNYTGTGTAGTTVILEAELNATKTITVIDDDTYSVAITSIPRATVDGGGPSVKFNPTGIATRNWDEQVFSTLRGYPRCVTFHERRIWFGGTPSTPDGLWSSWINRFFKFNVDEGAENESIQVSLGAGETGVIRHLVSNKHLQIFTSKKELYVPKGLSQQTVTPGNFSAPAQAENGISKVRPEVFDGATIYTQESGKTVREYAYQDGGEGGYSSTNISFISAHLISSPIDVAKLPGTTSRPEQYLMLLNTDGTLAVFHSARAEKLAAWVPWVTTSGDTFTSVCGIGGLMYCAALRGGVYWLEQFEIDDTLTLDSAATYSGVSSTVWTVDSTYQGKTVSVISGEYFVGTFLVDGSNQITLPTSVTTITIGFDFTLEIQTMPPSADLPTGPALGELARIARIWVWMSSTLALKTQGQRLVIRQVEDAMEASPTAAEGVYQFGNLGYSRQPTVIITQGEPLRARVLAIKTRVVA